MKRLQSLAVLIIVAVMLLSVVSFAHPGRTDSKGGHHDGSSYHYHHGYPPHQHTNNTCPYNFDDQTHYTNSTNTKGTKTLLLSIFDFVIGFFIFTFIYVFLFAICPVFEGGFFYKILKAYKQILKIFICFSVIALIVWILIKISVIFAFLEKPFEIIKKIFFWLFWFFWGLLAIQDYRKSHSTNDKKVEHFERQESAAPPPPSIPISPPPPLSRIACETPPDISADDLLPPTNKAVIPPLPHSSHSPRSEQKKSKIHTFGNWPEHIHKEESQKSAILSALAMLKNQSRIVDDHGSLMYIEGSKGGLYTVTANSCTCPDFIFNRKKQAPCKHIYYFALKNKMFYKSWVGISKKDEEKHPSKHRAK